MTESQVFNMVRSELHSAERCYPAMTSPHEGYAILLEEVDELWNEVKQPLCNRNTLRQKEEAIQVAAMAIRFILDVCNEEDG